MALALLLFLHTGLAHAELSAFEKAVQGSELVETNETVENYGGVDYRTIESSQGVYHFKLLGRQAEKGELVCDPGFNATSPHLVSVSRQVFRRSRIFLKSLRENCESKKGQRRFTVDWANIQVGVDLPNAKDDVIKDKALYTNPASNVPNAGFFGTW